MVKEIIISNRIEEVIRVSQLIEEIGVSLNIPSKTVMGIDLAIEEIISNIIQHAYPNEESSYIQFQIQVTPGIATFRITNKGIALDLSKNVMPDSTVEQLNKGLGNYLIHRTMDEIAYQTINGQHQLTLIKRINTDLKPSATLSTNICRIDGITILAIEGRLDTANAAYFNNAIQPLLEKETSNIIVNCANMTYISSSGLRSFLILQKYIQKTKGNLVIEGMSSEIKHIFEMTGCSSLFTIL